MTQYLIFSVLLIIYFELLGQSVFSYLKKDALPFSFFTGFSVFLGISYLSTSILTTLNISFYLLLFIIAIFFLASLFLIFKELKNIRINFKWYELLLVVLMTCVSLSFALKTTLGDPYSFDTTYYINCVVGAVGNAKGVNSFSSSLGFDASSISQTTQYSFQTFYYFSSVVVFILSKILSFLHREIFYSTIYIWVFQIFCTASLMSLTVNVCSKYLKRNTPLYLFICVFITLYFGKLYYINVFGFFGNTYRILSMSYVTLLTFELAKEKTISNKILITLNLLAGCAFSSSFLFILVFYLFGLVFIYQDKNIFKWYSITLLIPLTNLLTYLLNDMLLVATILSVIFSILLYMLNDFIYRIFNYKHTKLLIIISVAALMFLLSYRVTHNIFDFSAFTKNISERYDMTINYFGDFDHNFKIKIIFLASLLITLLSYKNSYSKLCLILIICFLNPFCCSFINKINIVYYRTYDIIFNPTALIYYFYLAHNYLAKNSNLHKLLLIPEICLLAFYSLTASYEYPDWFHESFVPPQKRYDKVNKFSKSEMDIVRELNYRADNSSYILTPNIFTFSMLNKGSYYFSRDNKYGSDWNEYDFIVRDTFYPIDLPELYDFRGRHYDDLITSIKKSHCSYIVIKNTDLYNDEMQETWYDMSLYLDKYFKYPDYSNDTYSIYCVDRIR